MKKTSPPPTFRQLLDLEDKLLELMESRSRLFASMAREHTAGSPDFTDKKLEKKLWALWKDSFKSSAPDPGILKKIFLLLNTMGYARLERPSQTRPFCLFPRNQSLRLCTQGPTDSRESQILCFISALLSQNCSFACVVNSPLFELVKALNKCGTGLSWTEDCIQASPLRGELNLDGNIVYAGKSVLTLYLLICLALRSPVRLKLTCASELKIQDFGPLQKILPLLGARLAPLEPHGNLLPARLESSAILPERIELPRDTPPEFVMALITCAPLYEQGLRIDLPANLLDHHQIQRCAELVSKFRPDMFLEEGTLSIPPGDFICPDSFPVPEMDPILSSLALALPYAAGGEAKLKGKWPNSHPLAPQIKKIFDQFGLDMEHTDSFVAAHCPERRHPSTISLENNCWDLLPLVLALVFVAGKKADIRIDTGREEISEVHDFLNSLGVEYSITSNEIKFLGIQPKKSANWVSPGPTWTLALSILSFSYPGVCIQNPGSISEVWPMFWTIFTNLPLGTPPSPKDEQEMTNQDEKKSGKRIRIN